MNKMGRSQRPARTREGAEIADASPVSPARVTSGSLQYLRGSVPRESRVEIVLGKARHGLVLLITSLGGVPAVLSVTDKDVHRAPITSDLFSQPCGWICIVPSVLSHWPPRPAICLQAVRQLAGVRGTLCDHRMHNVHCLQREDPGAFTSLAPGSQLRDGPQINTHHELDVC